MEPIVATCSAPVNIAVVKYWGKRDEKLILPVNSSLSASLNQEQLKTTTTVMASKDFERDQMWLNGQYAAKEEDMSSTRLQNCLIQLRSRAGDKKNAQGEIIVKKEEWVNYKLHIVSFNNFPTAAGLASSAAGFACLVYTIAQVYGIEESYPGELSAIARMGSGSACRSLYGGWVKWEMGEKADGSDSLAVQVADEKHWPEVVIAVLVVSEHRKPIGSTSAMERSVQNSDLLKHRAANVVPERMKQMEKAILERNFNEFGQLTIQDSNQFHAVCLDTYPPVMYLNDTSKFIINLLTQYNAHYGEVKAAYTFDAGPNAVIYTTKDVLPEILQIVHHYFPSNDEQANTPVPEHLQASLKSPVFPNSLQRIIQTNPGPGPILLDASAHLIDVNTGLPKAN